VNVTTRAAFDLFVIGAGMAGQTVAEKCASEGWKVAIADELPYGGTCALRGCDPKKMLVAAAEAQDWQRRMQGHGFRCTEARIDWGELLRFKRSFTDPVPERIEQRLARQGIATLHGSVRFTSPETLAVDGTEYQARYVVIATGAQPMQLGFAGEEFLATSTDFLELSALPRSVTFVGGGFISFEFAHVAVRAGARVRILETMERPLAAFDADLVELLVATTRELGIEIQTETRVTTVRRQGDRFVVQTEGADGGNDLETELVVHGAGRVARLDPLDLEAGDVRRTQRGVAVTEHLQSVSNPRVYAVGDAADAGQPLTPVAVMHGHVVASNLRRGNHRVPDHRVVPSVVFTIPPLAAVGLTEDRARQEGIVFDIRFQDTSRWYSSRRISEERSAAKVLVARETEQVIGAHLLGHGGEEVINLFALAMRNGIKASELRQALFAYPTKASDVPFMV
jgi:glutathione reductase (NADPH)